MEQKLELIITDVVEGTGLAAEKGALISCQFVGTLEDGTQFDSSYSHGRPFETVLSSKKLIQGWYLGLIGMKVGGKRKLFVPSHLAYGERERPKIPPHSNLLFEIELLDVRLRE